MAFDWGAVVAAALIVSGPSVTAAVVSWHNHKQIRGVKTAIGEVKAAVDTANTLTIGRLADTTESRRISAIPPEERSEEDWAHRRDVPPPQGE
jgi:hypothetical protein